MSENKKGPQLLECLQIYIKGMCMGAADIIPGVSGGTVAFITGIYDDLLTAIKSFTPTSVLRIPRQPLQQTIQQHQLFFLIPLGAGIATSLLLFAGVMTHLLGTYPEMLWSFFFGLIAASGILLMLQNGRLIFDDLIAMTTGAALAIWMAKLVPAQLSMSPATIFGAGFISIIAMILPGVSGAFILVLMGMYSSIVLALKAFDIQTILIFAAGASLGLALFSRALTWLLAKYHKMTVATLIGFMFGSLYKVWPWKVTEAYVMDHHGRAIPTLQINVSPHDYFAMTGQEAYFVESLVLMCVAVGCVFSLQAVAMRLKKRSIAENMS